MKPSAVVNPGEIGERLDLFADVIVGARHLDGMREKLRRSSSSPM